MRQRGQLTVQPPRAILLSAARPAAAQQGIGGKRVAVSEAETLGPSTPGGAVVGSARLRRLWLNRAGIAVLAGLYMLAWGISSLQNINPTDLDAFFLPSARIALSGHPLLVYALRFQTSYPNANGPLSLVPLTAVAALAGRLGWLDDVALRRMLIMATFSVFALLMAWEGVAAVDRVRGVRLRSVWRVLAYGVFAAAPTLWHGMLLYGHIEMPIMLWLTLFAVRSLAEGRPGRAGVAMGLAMLARSMAVFYLIPLLVLLIVRRRWRAAGLLSATTAATVGLGLLPFLVADRRDVVFSLVTFRGALTVGGGSLLGLTVGTPYESLAQAYDGVAALAAGVLVSAVVVLVRRDLGPASRDVYGLLALSGLCFPLLIKTTWPYYFLDPYIFLAVWWLGATGSWATPRRWLQALLLAYFVGCALIAEYGVWQSIDPVARLRESQAIAALLLCFMLVFGARLLLGDRTARRAMAGMAVSATSAPG
jgi:hypothetical protein